ncbi:hypothetical protein SLINC_4846 [Streptomyces lincolnensis]|uniref:Uncharacterized protein n=2 Tax=Streptomyces lincolnensis TaxID=1915 RepID=A0A1B1MEL7_STRLN|nr:DUF3558 family protein [Streptomyces lincolnensis]ANS67070.1 hypothetical protein SLINC_4846 [Streptomyces lincolnensis]AXG55942.1 hypothetical protein SLCG_4787 [Streptomyces lincolnensis]QMV07581.1 DUF3558 domain-containing protein [Streptomyces lincolnensis]
MSEGTMQRPAQRDQGDQRAKRRGRGLGRVLVCAAAVPVTLIVAGCSSDSGSGDADSGGKSADTAASASASPSPTVQAAVYKSLPKACGAVTKKTLGELVPKGKSGKEGTADEADARSSCSWSSLDNNGVKGSQFRWLNVSLLRFESDTSRGSGEEQAQAYYDKQIQDAQSSAGAKNTKSKAVSGTGDAATTVTYDLKKKEGSFKQQTVVTRVENVVITLDYNGAGLAGEKTPSAESLTKLAEKATKEAVAAVSAANGEGTGGDAGAASPSPSPSKGASKSPSPSASASASKAASSKSPSPSPSASKKS